MRKAATILVSIILLLVSWNSMAQDYKSLIEGIDTDSLQHPYVIFDNSGRQKILDRIANDSRYADKFEELKARAEKILNRTPEEELQPALRDMDARAKRTRDPFERFNGTVSSEAAFLAMLYQFTGDERYARKSFEYAAKVCAQDSWMSSAHTFQNIYRRVWPYGASDDQVLFVYDIYAADVSNYVSMTYDWLYNWMDKAQRDEIRGGLLKNTILRVASCYDYHWWTNASRCNWSGINHSAVGTASLAVIKENPELKWAVVRAYQGLNAMLDNIDEDGGWQEGRHYYYYGVRCSFDFMDALANVTGGAIDLYQREPLKSHPVDFMLYGLTGNFCDSDAVGNDMTRYAASHLAARTGDPTAAYFLQDFYPDDPFMDGSMLDFLYYEPEGVEAVKPADASKHFRGIDWAFLRKDFGDDYVQVATKAGKADDPHHGHLDIGTFNLTWKGEPLIGEFKRTYYDLKVFDEDRFSYLHIMSQGHNVVLVNNHGQQMSKHKDMPWGHVYQGRITGFSSEGDYGWVAMDNTGAYKEGDLTMWKRWIVLDKENNGVIVLDQVGCSKGDSIDVLFHPLVDHAIDSKGRSVSLDGRSAHMKMKALATSPLSLRDVEQKYVMQMTDFVPVDIPCYSIHVDAAVPTTCIVSVFYPTETSVKASVGRNPEKPALDLTVGGKHIHISATDGQINI